MGIAPPKMGFWPPIWPPVSPSPPPHAAVRAHRLPPSPPIPTCPIPPKCRSSSSTGYHHSHRSLLQVTKIQPPRPTACLRRRYYPFCQRQPLFQHCCAAASHLFPACACLLIVLWSWPGSGLSILSSHARPFLDLRLRSTCCPHQLPNLPDQIAVHRRQH
jgi:hypothetical protein